MLEALRIIYWPDPRLKKASLPVQNFDESLKGLAQRMLELMREHRGVGLAAPQVGQNLRLFVMNPTGQPEGDRVYVNPVLTEVEPQQEDAEEGCLSLPGINANVQRTRTMKIQAQDLSGQPFEQTESGYIARIWQHEFDHLNGTLILDRMGPVARMGARKVLKELEEKYAAENPPPPPKKAKRKDR